MKKFINKDKRTRDGFKKKELDLNILKIFKSSVYLNEHYIKNKNSSYNKIRNSCVLSGRTGGINRRFKISRNEIFKKLKSGEVEGLRRIYK